MPGPSQPWLPYTPGFHHVGTHSSEQPRIYRVKLPSSSEPRSVPLEWGLAQYGKVVPIQGHHTIKTCYTVISQDSVCLEHLCLSLRTGRCKVCSGTHKLGLRASDSQVPANSKHFAKVMYGPTVCVLTCESCFLKILTPKLCCLAPSVSTGYYCLEICVILTYRLQNQVQSLRQTLHTSLCALCSKK